MKNPSKLNDAVSAVDIVEQTEFQLGNIAFRKKLYAEASNHYRNAVKANPKFDCYAKALQLSDLMQAKEVKAATIELKKKFNVALKNHSEPPRLKVSPYISPQKTGKNKFLVVVPCFNAEETIEESVASVLNQINVEVNVVVVDDCSSDNSLVVVKSIEKYAHNVHLLASPNNLGPYGAINIGLNFGLCLDYDFFLIHGADDVMRSTKLQEQLDAIRINNAVCCVAGYQRVKRGSKEVIKVSTNGHSMAIYAKTVFEKLGYYDDTRFGGDTEYLERTKQAFGASQIHQLKKCLTDAYFDKNNITAGNPDDSKKRFQYVDEFRLRHMAMKKSGDWHIGWRMPQSQETKSKSIKDTQLLKICGLATIVGRENSLRETIDSILPQVDKLFVYQNGYKNRFDFLENEKIEVVSSLDTGIDMGDAGKFFGLKEAGDCLYFSIDDDLIYPPDYVERMAEALSRLNYEVIVTCHGRIMKSDATSYYDDVASNYKCLGEVSEGVYVHFGGTGVMAFRTSVVKISHDYFRSPNMADVWMGLYAKMQKVPIKVLPHKAEWIQYSTKFDHEKTLYRSEKCKTFLHDLLLRECMVQNLPQSAETPKKMNIAFIACAYGRPEVSKRFKNGLLALQTKFENKLHFINIVVDSENSNASVFASDEKFEYHNYENHPLSNKWSYALACALKHDIDYVLIIGSDDVIDEALFKKYEDAFNRKFDFVGILDMYVYDVVLDSVYYWGGYPNNSPRHGETIGLGRAFSREYLRRMDDELWPEGLNKSLDGAMTKKIAEYKRARALIGLSHLTLMCKDVGYAIDIKAGQNITLTTNFVKTGAQELVGEEKDKIKLLCSE